MRSYSTGSSAINYSSISFSIISLVLKVKTVKRFVFENRMYRTSTRQLIHNMLWPIRLQCKVHSVIITLPLEACVSLRSGRWDSRLLTELITRRWLSDRVRRRQRVTARKRSGSSPKHISSCSSRPSLIPVGSDYGERLPLQRARAEWEEMNLLSRHEGTWIFKKKKKKKGHAMSVRLQTSARTPKGDWVQRSAPTTRTLDKRGREMLFRAAFGEYITRTNQCKYFIFLTEYAPMRNLHPPLLGVKEKHYRSLWHHIYDINEFFFPENNK